MDIANEIIEEEKKNPGETVPFSRVRICESDIPCHAIFNKALNRVKRYQQIMHIDQLPIQITQIDGGGGV
jgi:hypothetical protein